MEGEQITLEVSYRYFFKTQDEYRTFVEHLKYSNFLLHNQVKTAAQTQKTVRHTHEYGVTTVKLVKMGLAE
jgi:hypothetical protein